MFIVCELVVLSKEGTPAEKHDAAAGGSKPKVKVKSIDLPIVANNIRQLDGDVLANFVEYEVRDPSTFQQVESCNLCRMLKKQREGAKGESQKL